MREPVIHDFRGPGRWGRRLHADTYKAGRPRLVTTGRLWWKRTREIPRFTVMVHMSPAPQPGDTLLYVGGDDADRRMSIVDVDYMSGDPGDMYRLILERPA